MVIIDRRKSTEYERERYAAEHPEEITESANGRPLVISWRRVAPWLLSVIIGLGSLVLWFERGWRVGVATELKENAETHLVLDHRVTAIETAEAAHATEMRRLNDGVEAMRGEQREFFRWVYERGGEPQRARTLPRPSPGP